MKKLLGYSCLVLTIAGCSKPASQKETPNDSNQAISSQTSNAPESNNAPAATNISPTGTNKPEAPAKSPEKLPSSATPIQPSTQRVRPRTENPSARHPQKGENIATDYKISHGGRIVEVEGICKLTNDEAICWSPSGAKNEALATEITDAVKNRKYSFSRWRKSEAMKKNRILVLKSTTLSTQNGAPGFSGTSQVVYRTIGADFTEGWELDHNFFNDLAFGSPPTQRQILCGVFEKSTEDFPLRYSFKPHSIDNLVMDPKKGSFTLDGNTYNISSITDEVEMPAAYNLKAQQRKFPKVTYVSIQPVTIKNPYSVVSISAADVKGNPFVFANGKGEPLTMPEFQKLQREANHKLMEQPKNGVPLVDSRFSYQDIGRISLDPSQSGRTLDVGQFRIEMSKIRKLALNVSRQTVYVFDKIRLDPN